MIAGVYKIRNLIDGKVDIGSSANVKARWYAHRYELRLGTHHSRYLQRAWDKYGEERNLKLSEALKLAHANKPVWRNEQTIQP